MHQCQLGVCICSQKITSLAWQSQFHCLESNSWVYYFMINPPLIPNCCWHSQWVTLNLRWSYYKGAGVGFSGPNGASQDLNSFWQRSCPPLGVSVTPRVLHGGLYSSPASCSQRAAKTARYLPSKWQHFKAHLLQSVLRAVSKWGLNILLNSLLCTLWSLWLYNGSH